MNDKKFFKFHIEYHGANYCGWQIQPNAPSIQETMEKTLFKLTKQKVRVHGSGRTDAGVHALGQVAHCAVKTRLNANDLLKGFNGLLPNDIIIRNVSTCPPDFHSRFSAKGKHYIYIVDNSDIPALWTRFFSVHIQKKLCLNSMRDAANLFLGTHNFKPFSANSGRKNEVYDRSISYFHIEKIGNLIFFHVLGKSFLYKMVRFMVGTIFKIGSGKETPGYVNKIFTDPIKHSAGPVAPAKGLTLYKVFYDTDPYLTNTKDICNFFPSFDVVSNRK